MWGLLAVETASRMIYKHLDYNELIYLVIYLVLFIAIYGIQKQESKDEMQKSPRPHIEANHQWYKKDCDTNSIMVVYQK